MDTENKKGPIWTKTAETIVTKMKGQKVLLPDNLEPVGGTPDYFKSIKNHQFKIVSYIDANCGVCIEDLIFWKKFMKETPIKRDHCAFIFYINTFDKEEFQKNMATTHGFTHTWVHDPNDEFISRNRLYDKRLQTVLLNKNNEVVIIGNPVLNSDLEKLYKKVLLF
ncbi:hypothetical protein AAG747_18035 [Rapidithrix thailandica]|uniref:Thioredoxin-like fold domain-containing protein n=1 Tax=Rapidithrix thailandica TaxID=413964 RepID=A0AAW9SDF1_9BACT